MSIRSASTNCEVFNMPANPSCGIPVVDFSAMSLDVKDPNLSSQAVKDLANQVYQAFSTTGVVYFTNYGIPQDTASLRRGRSRGGAWGVRYPLLSFK